MTIDEIREIVFSPDALLRKTHGLILLDEIDRLKERAEKAEKQLNKITQDERFNSMFPAFGG